MHIGSLADYIEEYIKRRLERTSVGMLEVQRRELADRFECVPSQINYVLSTRFTPDRGYIVESRRGGGGYIRITRISISMTRERALEIVTSRVGETISQREAERLLSRLRDAEVITHREAMLVSNSLEQQLAGIAHPLKDVVRARMLCGMLTVLLMRGKER